MPGQFVPNLKNLMLRRGGSRVPRTGREESGPLSDPRQIEVRAMYKTPSFLQAKGAATGLRALKEDNLWVQARDAVRSAVDAPR